jgi:hypothetical protein
MYLHCIILSYLVYALHSGCGTIYSLSPNFRLSWENLCRYFMGMTEKARRAAAFLSWYFQPLSQRTGLILPHMLGLDIVYFPHSMSLLFFCFLFFNIKKKKKKIWGRRCIIFLFFFVLLKVLFGYRMYFCLISQFIAHWLNMLIYDWEIILDICWVSYYILMLDSYFSHAMKLCTI